MKTLIFPLLLAIVLMSCDVGDSMREAAKSNPVSNARVIAADNGCMGCHAVGITVVGPSWKLVAKKYKNDTQAKNYLIQKIKQGGKGVWNETTGGKSMPAYNGRMTDEEITVLVDYILTL